MSQPIDKKPNPQLPQQPAFSLLQKNEDDQKIVAKQLTIPPLFRHYEKNLILFAYNKQADEDPPYEIMVMQQSKKHYNQVTEQSKVMEMFGNMNLEGNTEQLFLTKVNPLEHKEISQEIRQMLEVADGFSRKERLQRRREMFEAIRPNKMTQQTASEEVMSKRKIRVVKMDSLMQGGSIKGVVELGGRSIEYEDLNIVNKNQSYYTLVRRKVKADEIFPQVNMESTFIDSIEFQTPILEQEKIENEDDYDSNDSQNSAFDYPEEESNSRSSQGIIRDYDQMDEQQSHRANDDDQQELYRKYLRRVKRKQQSMQDQSEYNYQQYD